MKKYIAPEMELVKFQVEDILATSGTVNIPAEQGGAWNAGQGELGIPLD
ncbi:MAG: hypothetical protein IJJ41_03755 [Clostridia bacterium]|nr:hypothetical protein [Clostridia bacterium]